MRRTHNINSVAIYVFIVSRVPPCMIPSPGTESIVTQYTATYPGRGVCQHRPVVPSRPFVSQPSGRLPTTAELTHGNKFTDHQQNLSAPSELDMTELNTSSDIAPPPSRRFTST